MHVLRDPIWQFAGAILAFLALAVTLLVAWRQRHSKRLACIPRYTELLSVNPAIRSEVEISFRDRRVQEVSLVELRLVNFGSLPIEPRDFVSDVTITFGESANILTLELVTAKPDDLTTEIKAIIDSDGSTIRIAPVLLNRNDTFTLKCLVTSYRVVQVKSRISGLKAVEIRDEDFLVARKIDRLTWFVVLPISLLMMAWPISRYVINVSISLALGYMLVFYVFVLGLHLTAVGITRLKVSSQ